MNFALADAINQLVWLTKGNEKTQSAIDRLAEKLDDDRGWKFRERVAVARTHQNYR